MISTTDVCITRQNKPEATSPIKARNSILRNLIAQKHFKLRKVLSYNSEVEIGYKKHLRMAQVRLNNYLRQEIFTCTYLC